MSLYYDAASILSSGSPTEGSLKSRVYDPKSKLRSKPALIYALISETAKYDTVLKEVIDNAGILALEQKLTPLLSLLLVHDHLLSRRGIAAPTNHPLRLAVEKYKARLQAEFTKSRLRRGCASIEDLRKHLLRKHDTALGSLQPRWVRINNLRTSVEEQISTTFSPYTQTPLLSEVISASPDKKVVYIDEHIPGLLALPSGTDLTRSPAYQYGKIILQDKASCFPAYFLLGDSAATTHGDILDACAAPGNKTTHLASILSQQNKSMGIATSAKIFACERDRQRAKVLQKMVKWSTAESFVTVLLNQDFLALDPHDERFQNVTHLLLDPSCSGSGIIGREDIPRLALPRDPRAQNSAPNGSAHRMNGKRSKKRKRADQPAQTDARPATILPEPQAREENEAIIQATDLDRLHKLSNLQTRIIEHSFSFPAATHITYSTCSIHALENEIVVARALDSPVAKERGWRIWRREEQSPGLKVWERRGIQSTDGNLRQEKAELSDPPRQLGDDEMDACIRCSAGSGEGTMGFFVCGFVREVTMSCDRNSGGTTDSEDEWMGFDGER